MSLRARSFHIAIVLSLIAGLLASLLTVPGIIHAQDEAEFDEYPPSVTVAGEQFILDRLVPLDRADFERIEREANLAFYARTGTPPFDVIYGLRSGQSRAGMARYLPTNVQDPETPCLAEGLEVGPLSGGEATYAFAGIEADIPADELEEFAEADGQPVYTDPDVAQPAPELFLGSDDGLLRFLITDADGLPTALPETVPFAGQSYTFETDATETVDPATLSRVGCVGPFPALVATDAGTDSFSQFYLLAAGRYLSFTATGPAEDDTIGEQDEGAPEEPEATPPGDEEPIEDGDAETPADSGEGNAADDEQDTTDDEGEGGEDETPLQETPADAGDDDAADDEATDEETPADTAEETPAETGATDDGEVTGLVLEPSDDLGDGGQPDDLPRELTVGDARYLFDRIVPLARQDLIRIAQDGSTIVYARSEEGPFDAIYVSVPERNEDELARYLPERLDAPDAACPAEAVEIGQLDAGGAFYAFAGIETDLTGDLLEQIAESGGQPVYADPGADAPQPELFVTDPNGLLRFLRLGEDSRPPALSESLAFAGAEYEFAGDVTDSVVVADLPKVGCAGPFPTYAPPDEAEDGLTDLYVLVGGRLLQFTGEGAPVDEASPTEVPAELPTETAVPTDTEVPTEAPTETPTETPVPTDTEVPTETPTETPAPTDTEVPSETPVPEETATETIAAAEDPTETAAPETPTEAAAPTEAATEAPAEESPTEAPAETATTAPVEPEEIAQSVELPTTLEIENTTYVFNQLAVDINIETLVQVDVIVVNEVELTVYTRQGEQGVAPVLYCVTADGEVVGQYVLAAGAQPEPPEALPQTVTIENNVYIFNEVEVEIDIDVLVQVDVIVVNNVELTVYEEPSVPGRPPRLFVVSPDGEVVGQYVESRLVVTYQDTTAASTAIPEERCTGSVGPINEQGIPAYLPNRIQTGGIAYTFTGTQPSGEAGRLTAIGCIGPFEVLTTDAAPRAELLYLRIPGGGQTVFRFEAATTFNVDIGPSGNPRTIRIEEDEGQYRLREAWVQYVYSSQTVILFAADPEDESPDVFFAVNVRFSVVGEVIGEYRVPGEGSQPSEAMIEAATEVGLNADLTINGQLYLLVNIYRPVGTTEDGFVTLFAIQSESEGVSNFLVGRDKRQTELFIYDREE